MVELKGRSSDILRNLFDDTSEYTKAVSSYGRILNKKYPDEELTKIFSQLGGRTVTILPMAFCDAFSSDLGTPVSKKILAAVGLACVVVATHDDVVDETPTDQKTLAGLVYGGDITNLYALKTLSSLGNRSVVDTLSDTLNQNHYLQRRVVDKLWGTEDVSNEQYFDAVRHWCTFCSVGPLCALALTDRMDLKKRIVRFSTAYGITFQLLDDLREVDEDKERGYKSIPVQEGYPYVETFRHMHSHIDLARDATSRRWRRVNKLLDNMGRVVEELEDGIRRI